MVKYKAYKFSIVYIYKTHYTNFSVKLSKLPKGYTKEEIDTDSYVIIYLSRYCP